MGESTDFTKRLSSATFPRKPSDASPEFLRYLRGLEDCLKLLFRAFTSSNLHEIIGTTPSAPVTDAVFLVRLVNDGGNNGGNVNGVAATWTYTVKDYATNQTLKLNASNDPAITMSPLRPRNPWQANAATYGYCCRDANGVLILIDAFESYNWTACVTA